MSKINMIKGEEKIKMMKERLKEWNLKDKDIRTLASRSHERMTKEQFESFKKLVEYTVVGCKVIDDKNDAGKKRIEFVGKVDFKRNDHFCCVKKAGLLDKIFMCIKAKSPKPFLSNPLVHVASSDSYTHVAIRCDLQIKKFDVVDRGSRVYRNTPATSKIGNLPGIYLRGNGKTSKTGDLVGFSFRAEKNGAAHDQFFGNIWKNTDKS